MICYDPNSKTQISFQKRCGVDRLKAKLWAIILKWLSEVNMIGQIILVSLYKHATCAQGHL